MRKNIHKIICIVLTFVLLFSLNAPAFAAGEVSASSAPTLSNIESGEYITDEGVFVSWVTFLENGIASSIEKIVYPNGSYTITSTHGEWSEVRSGVGAQILSAPPVANREGTASVLSLNVNYTYWGETRYSVSIPVLQACSTVTEIASVLLDCAGFGTASMMLNIASEIFSDRAHFYSQYGSNIVYFKASKYYDIDDSASRPIYYHMVYTNYYSDSSYSSWAGSATDYYESLNFYF